MKDLTPKDVRCVVGACPRVFENEYGQLLIIGNKEDIIPDGAELGANERAIVISKELVKKALE